MVAERDTADEIEVLEGDEGEPEVGRHRDVGREVLQTPVKELRKRPPVAVSPEATVAKALDTMRAKRVSAVLVKRGAKLLGIFTERDVVTRCLPARGWASAPVKKFMTPAPETLLESAPVAYALNKMSVGRYRHIPLVDRKGTPTGVVSQRDVIDFLVELCPEEILNLPSDPVLAVHPTPDGD